MQFSVKRIWSQTDVEWHALLACAKIRAEQNVDYILGVYDGTRLIATGSLYRNMIKCLAVQEDYHGGTVFNQLITALLNEVFERKFERVFVYTKPENITIFEQLNFQVIASVAKELVFMERALHGFTEYLAKLHEYYIEGVTIAAIVMNANPFTKGHLHLVETAAANADVVHVFVVSEDISVFPAVVRKQLVLAGTAHIPNCMVHETEDYIVSRQTFPAYFLADGTDVTTVQATLDAQVFLSGIAPVLGITDRYVGEEPYSAATAIYNEAMQTVFGDKLQLHIIPRITEKSVVISATVVRKLLGLGKLTEVQAYVPRTTFDFLQTEAGAAIIAVLKNKTEEKE